MGNEGLMPPRRPGVIVYIAGYGRSGSTILDSAIAACVGGFGAGEVKRVFECMTESQYCECGEMINECPFWRSTLSVISAGDGDADQTRAMLELDRLTTRIEQVNGLQNADYAKYVTVWTNLLAELGAHAEVIVDSSKSTRRSRFRAQALADIFETRLFVIHLVRHPHGVLESALPGTNVDLERGRRQGAISRMVRGIRSMFGWVIANRWGRWRFAGRAVLAAGRGAVAADELATAP